jgi:hypothetical protein
MERYRSSSRLKEPALYRICIFGTLDKKWSAYYGGMRIEHESNPQRGAISILTGRLADQAALMGILNALYDIGCPLLLVEYQEID